MIYVVGSSFNSLAAANAFVNKGLDVTILDVGKKSTLQNKQIIKVWTSNNNLHENSSPKTLCKNISFMITIRKTSKNND